jgi:hypothetical protein
VAVIRYTYKPEAYESRFSPFFPGHLCDPAYVTKDMELTSKSADIIML